MPAEQTLKDALSVGVLSLGLPCLHLGKRLVNMACLDKYTAKQWLLLIKQTVEILIKIAVLVIRFDGGETVFLLSCYYYPGIKK